MFSLFAKSAMTFGAAAGCLLVAASSANAFTFTTNWEGTPPKGNIFLKSVEIDGEDFKNFAVVEQVTNFYNTEWNGGNTGAASSDKGDYADGNVAEKPDEHDIVASLGNLNLNNIVDTEESDHVSFSMDLHFDKAIDNLLIWERGLNSKLGIKIGDVTKVFTKDHFSSGETDYTLDTEEIGGAQKVGSYGIALSEFGITGKYTGPVTVFSNMYEDEHGHTNFNGPDFKIVGTAVPEPATVLGLTAIAGAFVASRRRKSGEAV